MYIGLDLSLRKSGIVAMDAKGSVKDFCIVYSDPKVTNDEELLEHNRLEILGFLKKLPTVKSTVVLEGLSLGSPSPAIDLIDANHWITRLTLKNLGFKYTVIPPRSWQKHIVTKEWLAQFASEYPVVRAARGLRLTKEQTAANTKSKAALKKLSKQHIFESVPEKIRVKFEEYCKKDKLLKEGPYDLADAYCLARHIMEK